MPWNTHKKSGQFGQYLSYEISGTMTKGTHEGQSASITTGGLAKVGGANEAFRGVIANIEDDVCTLQVRGLVTVPYTSTAPTVGAYNILECGASGSVAIDASNGVPLFVESVDTDAATCVVDLG